jgi:hypothetical protein
MKKINKKNAPKTIEPAHTRQILSQEINRRISEAKLVQNSYVLSRFWAWWCRIEFSPELRVPVPRFLTTRDP